MLAVGLPWYYWLVLSAVYYNTAVYCLLSTPFRANLVQLIVLYLSLVDNPLAICAQFQEPWYNFVCSVYFFYSNHLVVPGSSLLFGVE